MLSLGRQWFHPDSQGGLRKSAIEYDKLLKQRDYEKAYVKASSYPGNAYWSRRVKQLKHALRNMAAGSKVRKIFFDGFWPEFCSHDNQLLELTKQALSLYRIEATDKASEADISFYSCYGDFNSLEETQHTFRIMFLAENIRPSYGEFDISITCDMNTYGSRNIYFPVWALEFDWFKRGKSYPDRKVYPVELVTEGRTIDMRGRIPHVAYIGNNAEPSRMSFLSLMESRGIRVEYFGSHTRPVQDKISLLGEYKVNLCFENSLSKGYITEKPIHSYISGAYGLYNSCSLGSGIEIGEGQGFLSIGETDDDKEKSVEMIKKILGRTDVVTRKPLLTSRSAEMWLTRVQREISGCMEWL